MYYIIGDIGNTSTRICLLEKSKISKSIILDTKKIFLKGFFNKCLGRLSRKNLNNRILFSSVVPTAFKKIKGILKRNIIFVCCSISIQKNKKKFKNFKIYNL